jgi:WASH complex subunit strumpellin
LEGNDALKSADEELKESHVELLSRFYKLFESVHRYFIDLNSYLQDLEDGRFIQTSLESVFLDMDGKQLLCESLYLYGVMLLVLDYYIEGPVRERLLVAYFRYSGEQHSNESKFEDIVQLLRSTEFSRHQGKRLAKYPESFFRRCELPDPFVRMALSRLRSDDIYNQARCYPNPEHRCTAFAEQASMLFICLFFCPSILETEASTMREIVDKFFPDNWVVSVYMGFTFNLVDWWEPYKCAKAAMSNTTQASNIKQIVTKNVDKLQRLYPDTEKLLQEGALTEENVLDSSVKVLNIIRECNVTLRWLILHTSKLSLTAEQNKKCRQLRDLVTNETKTRHGHIFQLLLNTAQFEFKLRTMYKKMINRRRISWEK